MKKNRALAILLIVFCSLSFNAQVGIGHANPQSTLHVDGAKDNPSTGAPSAAQTSNDVVVTKTGKLGVGTIAPEVKMHIVATASAANRFSLIDVPSGTNQHVALALRNTSPLATGNYSLLGFTNSGSTSGGANWGIGSIRTGNTATNGTEEELFIGNSLGGGYNERMRINAQGNVGINTSSPNSSALLELSSTTKGFLPTRMTTAQRDAITPKPEGLMIYNLDVHCMQYWNASKWVGDCDGGPSPIDPCQQVWLGRSDLPNTYLINGQAVAISVSTTGGAGAGQAFQQCGGNSTTDAWGLGVNGASTTTFTFSQPINGVKFNVTMAGGPSETITVSAKNGATTVSPGLSSGQACFTVPTVTGNNVTESGTFTVGATATSITIAHNGAANGAFLHLSFCSTAQ